MPEARVILWKRSYNKEVEDLLQQNFPGIRIIHGNVNAKSEVDSEDVKAAFDEADLMIHGSGPSAVGKTNLEAWVKVTGKPFVLRRGYCFPDEAASVYRRAFAVLGFDCHSPIIALRNNTPAFYLRQPEDTIKGQMYYDIGLKDWVFEIEQTTGNIISERLTGIINDPAAAAKILKRLNSTTAGLFKKGTQTLKKF